MKLGHGCLKRFGMMLRTEAEDLANYDQELQIIGSDIDHKMIQIAEQNAFEAGFADLITFKQMQCERLFNYINRWCNDRKSTIR